MSAARRIFCALRPLPESNYYQGRAEQSHLLTRRLLLYPILLAWSFVVPYFADTEGAFCCYISWQHQILILHSCRFERHPLLFPLAFNLVWWLDGHTTFLTCSLTGFPSNPWKTVCTHQYRSPASFCGTCHFHVLTCSTLNFISFSTFVGKRKKLSWDGVVRY